MSFKTIFKTILRVAPAVAAHAPAVIAAVREVKRAARKTRPGNHAGRREP